MTRTRRLTSWALLLGLLALAAPAMAAPLKGQEFDSRYLSDKFYFEVGWFGADVTTDIAFGFGKNLGTFIRLERDLLLEENKNTGLFSANWRFNRRHAIAFQTTRIDRTGQNLISTQIEIEDPNDPDNGLRFEAGALVDSQFDNTIFGFLYRFSFYNNGKIDAGITAGLSFYDFSISLSGEAKIIDENGMEIAGTGFQAFTEDLLAPIPTIGIHLSYAISPRWIFRFTTDVLDLTIGDLDGHINQSKTTVQWFFIKNLSAGVGITTNNIDVRDTGDNPWRVDYRYGGFTVFLGAAF
jgi:hypothetical protein